MGKDNPVQQVFQYLTTELKAEFFSDQNSRGCVRLEREGGWDTLLIDSNSFESLLYGISRKSMGKTLTRHQVVQAQAEAHGMVFDSGATKTVFQVVARHKDTHYVQTGESYAAIHSDGNLEFVPEVPVPMMKKKMSKNLGAPVLGDFREGIELLRAKFHLEEPDDFYLILTFILKSLLAESGACPFICVQGGQGRGKTIACEFIKQLIDPSEPLKRNMPRNVDDFAVLALGSYMLAFDNISAIGPDLSDLLCMICTGGSYGRRTLYSNTEETTYSLQNVLLFNGIEGVFGRADLMDRGVMIRLAQIPEDKRTDENLVRQEFAEQYPKIKGSILQLLAQVVRALPNVTTQVPFRMTAYGRVGLAMNQEMALPVGTFSKAYQRNIDGRNHSVVLGDEMGAAIVLYMESKDKFEGSIRDLIKDLSAGKRIFKLDFKNPRAALARLERLKPALDSMGICVELLPRTSHSRHPILIYNKGDEALHFL